MTLELYAAFVLAVTVLMLIPGQNVALIAGNSIVWGTRHGLATVAGICAALVFQLWLSGTLVRAFRIDRGLWFPLLRWAGVAYLLWRGFKAWLSPAQNFGWRDPVPELIEPGQNPAPLWMTCGMGFLLSWLNWNTWLFILTFFPQFVVTRHDPQQEVWLLSVTYFAISAVVDSGWALLAGRLRPLLSSRPWLRNRIAGSVLIVAGAGLAITRAAK
jgi:homoserine/homoserine lactone efflux protein